MICPIKKMFYFLFLFKLHLFVFTVSSNKFQKAFNFLSNYQFLFKFPSLIKNLWVCLLKDILML